MLEPVQTDVLSGLFWEAGLLYSHLGEVKKKMMIVTQAEAMERILSMPLSVYILSTRLLIAQPFT